ncbi:MAG: DUF4381 family protein [Gemmatimonadota bacterium]
MKKGTFTFTLTFTFTCTVATLAFGQRVETGVTRDTIRVGDPFRAVVRIELPAGTDVALPDSLEPTADVENAGAVRARRDTANGAVRVVAAFPLTAWRPGPLELPRVQATLTTAQGRRLWSIALPAINVTSVLPADTAGIRPKPPKDVLGANRLWWLWLAIAIAVALAIAIAFWLWWRRRKRPVVEAPLPLIMPRERALDELERIRKSGLVEQGELKRFYTLVSEVLRHYMQTVEPQWRTHLTTGELARLIDRDAEVKPAFATLRQADMVKFARSVPDPTTATRSLDRTRDWISSYPAPAPATAPAERAA